MLANNLILFCVWWIYFQKFPEIRGWKLPDVAALYGVATGGYALSVIFGGGVLNLSRMITEGDLDSYMTQPKNLLLHTLGSFSSSAGWGDLFSAVFFFWLSGYITAEKLPLVGLLLVSSALIFLSSAVIVHSIAFWVTSMETLARQLMEFLIVFSVYPQSAFTGPVKWMLFTLIPAGFIGYLPVQILREFSWYNLFSVVGGAIFYSILAIGVFHAGLKKYESGNRIGIRT